MHNLWRISNKRFADLSGKGGLFCSGRWHSLGRPIVYFAEHPALAMLEVRVNMDLKATFLTDYVMMKVALPSDIRIDKIDNIPKNEGECQKLGDDWLIQNNSAICKVQSILVPQSYNYLFNPLHKQASKLNILDIFPVDFDKRLFESGNSKHRG